MKYTAMGVVEWLMEDVSDEQFAEIFALFELRMTGRYIPQIYDTEKVILNMDVDCACNRIKEILKEIQTNIANKNDCKGDE